MTDLHKLERAVAKLKKRVDSIDKELTEILRQHLRLENHVLGCRKRKNG